jgi:TolB-like protein
MDSDHSGAASGDASSGEPPVQPSAVPGPASPDGVSPEISRKKKKKEKVRSAWISFVGRIVAQILGAAASVILGLYVLSSYKDGLDRAKSAPTRVPREPRPAGAEPSLAVLPFDNFSADASQEYFVDGVTETLVADLARIRGLRVISRTSSMHYKGQKKAVPEIAAELGVDLIIEGSVVRSGNRVRVIAQLIDGRRDEHIWARSYEHTVDDVLAVQSEIAKAIAGAVRAEVGGWDWGRGGWEEPVVPSGNRANPSGKVPLGTTGPASPQSPVPSP